MEEPSRILPSVRDRKAGEALTVIPAPSVLPWDQAPREPHLLDYLIILRKHQWLIVTFLLTVVTVVTIASFKMKPVYRSCGARGSGQGSANHAAVRGLEFLRRIRGQRKLHRDANQNTAERDPGADDHQVAWISGAIRSLAATPNAIAWQHSGGISHRPAILGAFLGRLGVSRVPNSRLIQVQFEAEDPQLAAQVVNAHLQNYVEQNFRSKYDATIQASNWLSAELEELRIKVENSENARIAYERENKIWQIDEKQDITTQKLADLSKAATDAQTDVAQKEALYRMAISADIDALPAARSNDVISALVRRKSELAQQYADAVDQYGPNFPKVLRIAAQQKQLEESLASARKTMVESIEEEYETSKSHADLLQEALDKQKEEANELAEKLVQYHILQHDAESNKQLYDGLLQKLKEAGITAGLRSSNIRVVDPALAPSYSITAAKIS